MKLSRKILLVFTLFLVLALSSCGKKYTVKFETNGGSYIQPVEVSKNDTIGKLPIPTKEKYIFDGWHLDNNFTQTVSESYEVTKDLTLYAKWKESACVVTFENYKTVQVNYGDKVSVPAAPTKVGHNFAGWYTDSELTNKFDFSTPITSSITLYQKWSKKTFNVAYCYNGETTKVEYEYGSMLDLSSKSTKDGYHFVGWSYYGDILTESIEVVSNMTLYEVWEIKDETLKSYIDSMIPTTTISDLNLFTELENCTAEFVWTSSNKDVIGEDGKVRRATSDVTVKLEVNIIFPTRTVSYEYNVLVKKLELKSLVAGKIVSGYLYAGSFNGLPQKAIEQLDYINYSFAKINNGVIQLNETDALKTILSYRNEGVRVGLAIGGWGAGGFSEAMHNAASRTKLIDSIMEKVKYYQFDGIDIDWEYPTSGAAGIAFSASDRENLNLFCKELRERFNKYRSDLVISIAVTNNDKYFDFNTLKQYVNYFNLMTYDFALGKTAYHDSALYSVNATASMDNSVRYLLNYVDASMIIPGAAFYGRRAAFASSASTYLCANLSTDLVNGSIDFKDLKKIMLQNADFVESYDEQAEAAYAIYNNIFYTYDNERSVKAKCDYIKTKQLGGIMCWELTQDYTDENGVNVLLNTMYQNLN